MSKDMIAQKTINGTYGEIWFNGQKLGNCKAFQAKVTGEYQELDISGKSGKYQKWLGYSIAGTITLIKLDSTIVSMVLPFWKTHQNPTFTIVGKLADPSAYGAERISLTGVTIDEATLLDYEQKTVKDEEVPFKAEEYDLLDLIV